MSTIIVGHGPSMLIEKLGHVIDKYDNVIRLKKCQQTLKNPEFYGTKTTHVGGSLTIAGDLREVKADIYWVFVDSRHRDIKSDMITYTIPKIFGNSKVIIDRKLCDDWDKIYRDSRIPTYWDGQMKDSKSCDTEFGENHTSQGFKAILYACQYLPDEQIDLIGFDNLFTGVFTWSTTRGPDWMSYPKHNWATEHKLIPQVETFFKKKINFILPEIS
jgi:hypothetical protein